MCADRLAAVETGPGPAAQARARSAAPPEPRLRGHLPALDGVRGLAILAVLLLHFVANTTPTNRLEEIASRTLSYGVLGVDLFFVLSGFLITGILYDARYDPSYFKNFYMRRVLRIFPLYYAVLVLVFLVVPRLPFLEGSQLATLREHQAWGWLYGINVYIWTQGGWPNNYIQHFWSLAVEEHFYFVWPLVVWLLASRPRALLVTCLAVAGMSVAGRVVASLLGAAPVPISVLTPFQLDALCLGGFFAVLARQPGGAAKLKAAILPMAAGAAGVLVLTFVFNRFTDFGFVVLRPLRGAMLRVLLATILLHALMAAPTSLVSRFFRSNTMIFLGKYSYGLYVYHHFLSFYLVRHGTEFALARAVGSHTLAIALQAGAGIAASIAIAWLSYEAFEKRFLQLKSIFSPASARPGRKAAING